MVGKIKITSLVDDYCPKVGLLGEHGLAILIETPSEKILFDTGQGLALKHNAKFMNINLTDLDCIALSHGHNNHTGGLKEVFELSGRKGLPVYAHKEIFSERYKIQDEKLQYSGIPYSEDELKEYGAEMVYNSSPTEIAKGVYLTGYVEREFKETSTKSHFVFENGEKKEDQFNDDQSLVIDTNKGPIIVFGCAHAGIVNTMNHIEKQMHKKEFFALIGGTHLLNADEDQLRDTLGEINKRNVKALYLSHCTGIYATAFFHKEFRGDYKPASSGFSIEF